MSTFLLPFKGRNSVNAYHQNFLWNHENVYIMDNHRAALWCWLQSMSNDKKYSVYHIDMHYDLSPGIVKRLPENLPDLATITFNEYLSLSRADGGPVPLIIYDNYLSIFEEIYGDRINYFFAATQEVGTPPAGDSSIEEVKIGRLADSIRYNLFDDAISADGWIVNLDLDYFFAQQPKEYRVMFSDSYIEEVFGAISDALRKGRIHSLTIALSPECCGDRKGNWNNSESLCRRFVETLGLDFELPV